MIRHENLPGLADFVHEEGERKKMVLKNTRIEYQEAPERSAQFYLA